MNEISSCGNTTMDAVKKALEEKGLAQTTIDHHLALLRTLNNGKAPKSLAFLKDTEAISKRIAELYAPSTQLNAYSTLVSVLTFVKDKPLYRKAYETYYDTMMRMSEAVKESREKSEEKTKKQEENWITWEEVKKKRDELTNPLHRLVLSLYTEISPRRNQDYLLMRVVKKTPTDSDANYLVMEKGKPKRFIFNKYKTAKKYGTQIVEIPSSLASIITDYLKANPVEDNAPLLVSDGKPLTAVNSITRILNRIFGKKVGSSMLRHIYLSSKYDIAEMKKDATDMAHSLSEQRNYLKSEPTQVVNVPTVA